MKSPIVSFLLLMLLGFSVYTKANTTPPPLFKSDTLLLSINQDNNFVLAEKQFIFKDTTLQKKALSALFAFPFPFGFMGAHRVILGTKPWVPVVYVATLGGCFGLLPLIDFFVITLSKDISQYENNPNIFMWIKPKENQ
ncbi:MAG: hypothetical protein JNL69_12860 [Bacteroidia bacterium]|nr:hypothetical protein [Bacteroidia bacterium]